MWIAGYVLHMPLVQPYVPPWVVFAVLVMVMFLGGYVFGRDSLKGWRVAWVVPVITALVNMLIFSSVLKGENRNALMVSLPGFFGMTLLVMLIGFAIGKARRRDPSRANWRLRLALVPVLATALVVSAGGLVTGFDAGFSVPDWPTTYGANMFLYPVAHMTGGVFYEHGHRLAGTLVGIIAIVVAIYMWATSRRWWLISLLPLAGLGVATLILLIQQHPYAVQTLWFIAMGLTLLLPLLSGAIRRSMICWGFLLAIVMVITQGVAGGLWVKSAWLPYILFHGSFGQIILATFAVIAATHAPSWRKHDLPLVTPSASTDHTLTVVLLLAFIAQTLLGVYVRKSPAGPLMMHITFAAVVVALVVAVTLRGLMLYRKRLPPIKRVCNGLLHGVTFQVLLGFAALGVRQHNQGVQLVPGDPATTSPLDATITTLHQSIGAFLLAFAALAVAWNWRLLRKRG